MPKIVLYGLWSDGNQPFVMTVPADSDTTSEALCFLENYVKMNQSGVSLCYFFVSDMGYVIFYF